MKGVCTILSEPNSSLICFGFLFCQSKVTTLLQKMEEYVHMAWIPPLPAKVTGA
jgi:hypothetical protein